MFQSLRTPKASINERQKKVKTFSWIEKSLSHLDSRTPECESYVQRLIHLQAIANRLPDVFNDDAKITKSHIPIVNALVRIVVYEECAEIVQNGPHLKRGRTIGSKKITP